MKKVLKIVGIVLLVLIVIGMFGKKKEPANVEAPVEAPAEAVEEAPAEAEQIEAAIEEAAEDAEEEYRLSVDDIITLYEISLGQNFNEDGQGYEVKRQDNAIIVNVWSDGITAEAMEAKTNDAYRASWDQMVENLKDACKSFQNVLDENGYSDMAAAVCVVNDVNHDKILLMIAKDTVMYDAVNEIDLIS